MSFIRSKLLFFKKPFGDRSCQWPLVLVTIRATTIQDVFFIFLCFQTITPDKRRSCLLNSSLHL